MKILIGIATYKRPDKVKRLLESLKAQTYRNFDIAIVFDNNDHASKVAVMQDYGYMPIRFTVADKQSYVIGCWNRIHAIEGYDAHLMLCDDVELLPNCVERALEALKMLGSDSVVGITQKCPGNASYTFKPYGQTLMGRKFIDRYKIVNYQVCCPYYTHFYQDEEMWAYANKYAKAILCDEAVLNHYHPAFIKSEMDATHHIVRTDGIYQKDLSTFKRRQSENKLWGESFAY